MNTIKLYNDNVYLSECTATVTDVTEKGVILDHTIFSLKAEVKVAISEHL